jgi:Beta-propeller repeat
LGSSGQYGWKDSISALTLDTSGRIYVGGRTYSTDFPVTPDAAVPTCLAWKAPYHEGANLTDS